MSTTKKTKREFKGLTYLQVQQSNANNRKQLTKKQQKSLKADGYKNVGWDNVIKLYQKITELQVNPWEDTSLEDLFLASDRIGSKYQSKEEKQDFEEKFNQEVEEINELVEQIFPDTEVEVIDFSDVAKKPRKNSNQKKYRTLKV